MKQKKTKQQLNNYNRGNVAFLGEASTCCDDTAQWEVKPHVMFPIIYVFVFMLEFTDTVGNPSLFNPPELACRLENCTSASICTGRVERWAHYYIMYSTGVPPLTCCAQVPTELKKMLIKYAMLIIRCAQHASLARVLPLHSSSEITSFFQFRNETKPTLYWHRGNSSHNVSWNFINKRTYAPWKYSGVTRTFHQWKAEKHLWQLRSNMR